jgi:hypothetical protein
MTKIDLEKVLIALLDSPFNKQFDDKVKDALKEQGLKYKDGEIVEIQKPLYEAGNIIIYKGYTYGIKEVVKNEEKGFHYNLIAIDGGEVISIGPAGEKDITLFWKHANIQQKDFAPKASTANRQLYNRAILEILSNYVEKYPDIRFGQMLCNLGTKPHFDEESKETYCNLCKTINKRK